MKNKKITNTKTDAKLSNAVIKDKTAYIINLTKDMQDLMRENERLKGKTSYRKFLTKDCIDAPMINCVIKHKGTNGQHSRIFCERIEYLHDKNKDYFNHHLFFFSHGLLVLKIWLPNSSKDKPFKDVFEALESCGIKCSVRESDED